MEAINYVFGRGRAEIFSLVLEQNGFHGGIKRFWKIVVLQAVGFYLLSLAILLYLNFGELIVIAVPFIVATLIFPLNYLIQSFINENRKRELENIIPDMLLQASVFPKGTPIMKIISYLAGTKQGSLSSEFKKCQNEIERGASVEEALRNISKRNKSKIIGRAVRLLVQGYNSGADLCDILKETAEDMMETNNILRQRMSTLIVEKYTLLFAGGIIVPLVLGLLVGMVNGLNFSSMAELSIGMDSAQRTGIINAALLGNILYIAEYSIIASLFIANQENNMKKALIYATFLMPASLAVYHLAQML